MLAFTIFDGITRLGAGWRFARFPRLPQPVVPIRVLGAYLAFFADDHGVADYVSLVGKRAPSSATGAVVQFVLWQRQAQRTAPAQSRWPLAVASTPAQAAYWRQAAAVFPGAAEVGDWRHYLVSGAGWPQVRGDPYTQILAALRVAGGQASRLPGALQKAEDTLNTWAAQYVANVHQAAIARQARVGMAQAFPVRGAATASRRSSRE